MRVTELFEGYSGYELQPKDRHALLTKFPPLFPDVIAHHITSKFGTTEMDPLPPNPNSIVVVGQTIDEERGIQALVVAIDGQIKRPDGSFYHITWSIDRSKGAKPVMSNNAIQDKGFDKVEQTPISVVPKFWKH